MSRLARKMYHGIQNSLFLPSIRVNSPPIGQDTPPAREQRGKRAPPSRHPLLVNLTLLCYLDESRTAKTAWEHYNEGTSGATSRCSV